MWCNFPQRCDWPLLHRLTLSDLCYCALNSWPGGATDDAAITLVWAWLPRARTAENSIYSAAHCTGWAFVIHYEGGVEILRAIIDQHIRTNATTALTQNSRCIAQLISLLGQVAKDEGALVAQDLVEVGNPLRQPGK